MKKRLSFLLAVVLLLTLCACGKKEAAAPTATSTDADTSWSYIEGNGKIVVGLDDTFAPMGFRTEDGELVGFDIDLANAVGETLGVAVEFKPIVWDAKEMELEGKKIDLIWNGMSKTPERVEGMNLSAPYLNNSIVIMTLADSAVKSKADLAGKNIGIQVDSAALEVVKADAMYGDIVDGIAEYESYDEAVMDLDTGRLDAVIIDKVAGKYKASKAEGTYAFAEEDFGEDYYVIGMRKGDDALTEKIDNAMKAVIESGKAAEISTKWFGEDLVLR
ncbi:MAG: amino acid ABC transporter substrate-binding protein [Clostridia bacterium]|nr:amino acid ABC transporter substrate-binding protein [Clostridia bacterium]